MPIFEYTCRECRHQFETLVSGNRQAACPRCKATDLEKMYSTFATRAASTPASGAAASRFT
jgi:putative FmdB family regulatory protein